MKKSKFYWLMTLILSCFICHTVSAGCPSGQTEDQTTGHCIKSASSCNGKCTYYYDTTTHDLRLEKNAGIADEEEVIIPSNTHGGNANITGWSANAEDTTIRNITIGEGITGADSSAFSSYNYRTGCAECTLTLPSTFKSNLNETPFWNLSFGTIDASALKDTELYLPTGAVKNVIVSGDSNLQISLSSAYGNYPSNVVIQCKGTDLKACTDQISYPANMTTITPEYYSEVDSKGRIHQWSKDGLFIYQYSPNGDYTLYDENENLLGHFMSNGSKRRIYSVEEATAVVQTGAKNTFSIKYR